MQNIAVLTTLKMAKRHAYEAQFKLKAISHAEEHGNRAAAREFKINESMVRKWRKLENELRQVTARTLTVRNVNLSCVIYRSCSIPTQRMRTSMGLSDCYR